MVEEIEKETNMKVIEIIEFINDVYGNKQVEVRKDEEDNIHFFEVNKEGAPECEVELSIDTVKWCVQNGKLPRKITPHIPLADGEVLEVDVYYHYKGKSTKLITKKVIVLSKSGNRCKVQDMEGNETSVAESQITPL